MSTDPLRTIGARTTPQTEPVLGRTDMVENHAGGYVFGIDPMAQAVRFLVLGTTGGTYYQGERELTVENAALIVELAAKRGIELVQLLVDVSLNNRAPKVQPTLFALAACAASSDLETRKAAYAAIGQVCRTATHLMTFATYVTNQRGWSRGLRTAVAAWYERPSDVVGYQAVKYRQRGGWTHRDLLRLSHAKASTAEQAGLFDWMCGRTSEAAVLPEIVVGFERIQAEDVIPQKAALLITEYGLPWECVPDRFLTDPQVWEAILDAGIGVGALIRNLGRLTSLGVIRPLALRTQSIAGRIAHAQELHKARVHPVQVLDALLTYRQGHGARGGLSWDPVAPIIDALDAGFYAAFAGLEPAGKRTMLALDVSGSMANGACAGSAVMTPREGSAAMAMVTAAKEPDYAFFGFSDTFVPLAISPRQRLDDVLRTISGLPFRSTDCSLPMQYALSQRIEVDTFVIYTDNETYAGSIHPFQALRRYRDESGIPARLIVVGMTSTGFTIADPTDPGMLDVVGFDAAAPNMISGFSRGDF